MRLPEASHAHYQQGVAPKILHRSDQLQSFVMVQVTNAVVKMANFSPTFRGRLFADLSRAQSWVGPSYEGQEQLRSDVMDDLIPGALRT